MQLNDLLSHRCVIGLSYFDEAGTLLKQSQLAGKVTGVDAELGITVQLQHQDATAPPAQFILPPNLAAWFKAPPGHYRHAPSGVDMENPDYLVTWDIHRNRSGADEGQHEWWDWVPNTAQPGVGPATA